MSLTDFPLDPPPVSFPRVSGDEPGFPEATDADPEFSPRERG